MILYLHGFNSGPGEKYETLKKELKSQEVVCYEFLNNPFEDFDNLKKILKNTTDDEIYIVGTSLGGFYGMLLHAYSSEVLGKETYSFLINASYKPFNSLKKFLNKDIVNFKTKKTFKITKSYLQGLEDLYNKNIDSFFNNIFEVNFYFSYNDEVLSPEELLKKLLSLNKPLNIKFEDQPHRFQDISNIIEDIKKYKNFQYEI